MLAIFAASASVITAAIAAGVPAMPMPIDESKTANYRWLQKPVLDSRLLDGVEQTNHWSHHGHGQLRFTTERARDGKQSVRLLSPTKTDKPSPTKGRPFGEAIARLDVPDENWTDFNRVSFWVYPRLPGFKIISLLVRLRNDGATKVPDSYGREGLNFVLLQPDLWNRVVWEIPHLSRDKITGLEFVYRLQGNEPGATDEVCFDIDQIELQRVEPDPFEGWSVAPGQLAYCHSGYQLGDSKIALAQNLEAREFTLVSQAENKLVLTRPVQSRKTDLGEFQLLDFSEFTQSGVYRLQAGDARTPWFRIGEDAWRDSIWKTINLFYCERCGQAIPGIHDKCHGDWTASHGTNTIAINGGWHDAGDLSQGLVNTSEAAYAMLDLAEKLATASRNATTDARSSTSRAEDLALARRAFQEARWGVDWILKTRFGDGARVTWATMDYWTDGVLGGPDDTTGDSRNSPLDNFMAASAEAKAAQALQTLQESRELIEAGSDQAEASSAASEARKLAESDARRVLTAAGEDWQFAVDKARSPNLELASAGALASIELFKAAGDRKYAEKAIEFAGVIVDSQQREYPPWDIPLTGFFYSGPKRERILHYAHRGHEQAPTVALAQLCELFPEHREWMKWYSAVVLHSEYLKRIAQFTEPWSMLPASVYSLDESNDGRFKEQVRNGIKLSDKHYLRRFPVWFDFRGNAGTGLSQAKALSAAARLRGDRASAELARKQLEWIVGRNPFGQSLMFGEGHDYAPQYTAMSGDMVGSLPVGIQTRENGDAPYWPAANCYNYKEVWVHPSSRWLAIMTDLYAPLQNSRNDREQDIPSIRTSSATQDNIVTIEAVVRGKGGHRVTLRASNLVAETPERVADLDTAGEQTLTWRARIGSPNEPWVALLVVDNRLAGAKEILENH